MSNYAGRALTFVVILLFASISPMAYNVSAHPSIHLSVDKSHIVLQDGHTDNLTLTIDNNGTSIESFDITLDLSNLPSVWNVTSVNETVDNVLPTFSADTTFIVRLDEGAVPSDSGSFVIIVTEPDADVSTNITVYASVDPSYETSVSFSSMNGPLQQMNAGTSANYVVDIWNDGNVEDTILLNVDSEPDLASFWSNTSNGTGTGNGSGNGTGNETGNGTGNGSSNATVPSNVLMYGNSYTASNNLASLLESLGVVDTESIAPGGYDLAGHWDDINTSMHISNTTLRNPSIDWDYVILQDQSQIPSLPTTDTNWQESKNGAVKISTEVEAEGSEIVLFMTWGRRSGESGVQWHQNNNINQNYSIMQSRLADGYIHYAENISAAGNTVWVAPVGLAFQHIHDAVEADGTNASQSGNTFYNLYTSDGSHPSLSGSYLSACVLYATMVGESPVGSNDTVALSASLKLELQQAAAATVFNETSHMSYPWEEVSGSSISPTSQSSRSIPAGWNVLFDDAELTDVPADSYQQVTLQISVPSDAVPGFYGFNLYSASTKGNVSSYSTMVVEVVAENDIGAVFLDQDANFIPGQTTNTSVQVTNLGNAELDMDWTVELISGPCNISLLTASSNNFAPDDVVDVGLQVIVEPMTTSSDECIAKLGGSASYGEQQYSPDDFDFTIGIDENVEFELSAPQGGISVTPGTDTSYEIRLNNSGSEDAEFFLDVGSTSGIITDLQSSTGVTVASGSVGIWTLHTDADAGMVGNYSQSFSVTYSGVTKDLVLNVNVASVPLASLTGPIDGRISVIPGQTVSVELELFNDGTQSLELIAGVSGLPAGAEVSFDPTTSTLSPGQSVTVNMALSMVSTASSGTHQIVVTYGSSEVSASLNLELQIADSVGLAVNSVFSSIAVGPLSSVDYTFEVTNLGSAQDTFLITLSYDDSNNATDWFDLVLSTASVSLAPSSTQAITLSIREMAVGAPVSGVSVSVMATSTSDEMVSSSNMFNIIPVQASAQITILEDSNGGKPGEQVAGTVVVTNTGTGLDQFMLTTPGDSCGLSEIFTLDAGSSSQAYSWSCAIDEDSPYGYESIIFRVTSGARINYVLEEVENYVVEANWGDDGIAEMSFGTDSISMSSSGGSSTTFTVKNLANAPITGTLFLLGTDESLFDSSLTLVTTNSSSNQFTLDNGESVVYELLLNSRVTESQLANLMISASVEIDGATYTLESGNLSVEIEGPEMPPEGVELLFGVTLDKSQTLYTMFGGWIFSISLLVLMNMLRKRRKNNPSYGTEVEDHSESDEDAEEKKDEEVEAHSLATNECRMSADNKVTCPSCEARLGVPRGSVPPFKFTCPKCEIKIRVIENQKF
ncbi:MAG: hypothetical protein HOI28_02880 [Euryarchaeota archaeon]|jgi:uncharacterized membrane protein|nr:hypothetical protein [Euryarchaeota archaeon]